MWQSSLICCYKIRRIPYKERGCQQSKEEWGKESFLIYKSPMAAQDKGPPLPKFGEWDVNNPASAEGFTVIFSKARDEKKGNTAAGNGAKSQKTNNNSKPQDEPLSPTKKRFCCF
ncbi:hypothetical protein L6164_005031 [Bauhinia variegata]|uniref:Uncharacterized protein n=1 Tax=Bauhinia variegata TaxID=167791 RepID=A0ACB9PVF6_BAUVA|nr:hypothetical protein L6164_005031 [Bauhinia variegata]